MGSCMKFSRYLIETCTANKEHIIFSTISKSIVKFSNTEYNSIINGNTKAKLSNHDIAELLDKRILINDTFDEDSLVDFEMTNNRIATKVFTTFLALSTQCNFACVYCYEKGIASTHKNVVSNEKLDELIKWYLTTLKSNAYEICHIVLYGGEPLIQFNNFKLFIDKLKIILDKIEVKLELEMISNGYLLDTPKLDYLVNIGLKEVQITLDGVGSVHDARRPLKNGKGTFDQIIRNIKTHLDLDVQFVIRASFDLSNIDNIAHLLEYLDHENLSDKIILYFAPVHHTISQLINKFSYCSRSVINDEESVSEALCSLYSLAKEYHFKIPYYYTDGPCMTIAKDSYLVAPDGKLYKCVEMMNIEELCVGSISEKTKRSCYYEFVSAPYLRECLKKKCIYAPICGGGCAMRAYLSKGKPGVSCQMRLLKRVNEHLLYLNFCS